METKLIKDLMIPIDDYATVNEDTTLLEAMAVLEKSQENITGDLQPYRAVLVADKNGNIVGKIGHLGFLKALEPRYNLINDFEKLTRAGVSSEFINSMMDNLRLWQSKVMDICKQAEMVKVKDAMQKVEFSIDENSSLIEAIHSIVIYQSLSILVSSGSKVVGILRLSDLYEEVSRYIRKSCT